jgi:hypothetical protein
VLLVGCLAEAHDLPIPRAAGAALLSIILGVLAIILLVLLVLGVRHTLGS